MGRTDPGETTKRIVRASPLAVAVISGILHGILFLVLWSLGPEYVAAGAAGSIHGWLSWIANTQKKRGDDNGR